MHLGSILELKYICVCVLLCVCVCVCVCVYIMCVYIYTFYCDFIPCDVLLELINISSKILYIYIYTGASQ